MADATTSSPTFPAVSLADWRDERCAELGAEGYERKLVSRTREGLRVEPLHDDTPGRHAALPGRATRGWRAEVDLDARGGAAAARTELARDLAHGVSGVRAALASADDLPALLEGVDLATCAVHFLGGDARAQGAALLALARARGVAADALRGGLGAEGAEATAELARWTRDAAPGLFAARASAAAEAERGAGEALQLALVLARGHELLRAWCAGGLALGDATRALELELALGTDVFVELAKLRALRLAWARLVAALGGDAAAQRAHVCARAARRVWTRCDPWVNLLRGTTIAFAAAAGGADAVVLLPYDACLGASDAEARRLAANTHALLALESRLGFVEDPGAGAGLVEELTAALARRAWELFQELVAQGGVDAAHASGWLDTRIAESADRDARDVRTRRRGIVGVSEYPALDEALPARPPLREAAADARLAAPFEALRARSDRHLAATGARPRAFLANLGPVAEHTARATFARNLLAAGGIEAPANDGFASVGDAVAAFEASGARLCVICSSDARYAEAVPELAPELARRGALVVVAGRAGEREDAWRAAGVAHFVHLGCDALASLAALLDAAEVAA